MDRVQGPLISQVFGAACIHQGELFGEYQLSFCTQAGCRGVAKLTKAFAGRQIKKDEENANWTCLIAPVDKEGDTLDQYSYVPKSLGLSTLGKKGLSVLGDKDGKDRQSLGNNAEKDKVILGSLTMSPGLHIPPASNPDEPNLRCRMYRNKYPDVEETVVVLVKRIDVMGVYVNLIEYDDTEGMILLSELSRRRIRSVKKLVSIVLFAMAFPCRSQCLLAMHQWRACHSKPSCSKQAIVMDNRVSTVLGIGSIGNAAPHRFSGRNSRHDEAEAAM